MPVRTRLIPFIASVLLSANLSGSERFKSVPGRDAYVGLLDVRSDAPGQALYFSDHGAWHAYGLGADSATAGFGAFRGPFLCTGLGSLTLAGEALVRFTPLTPEGAPTLLEERIGTSYRPGVLEQSFRAGPWTVSQRLIFVSGRTSVTFTTVRNNTSAPREFIASWSGKKTAPRVTLKSAGSHLVADIDKGKRALVVRFPAGVVPVVSGDAYSARSPVVTKLEPGAESTFATVETYEPASGADVATSGCDSTEVSHPEALLVANAARWNGYLSALLNGNSPQLDDDMQRALVVKAVQTLMTNWRSAAGDQPFDGVFPALNYFNACWSWDSWQHAAALAYFAPELAKDQMRVMFAHQSSDGFVPDLVALDRRNNNNLDTKPPVASWPARLVWLKTGDKAFVREIYPKLKSFHAFWYAKRDRDGDGLCEYGANAQGLDYARWESGLDNAAKFDDVKLLPGVPGAWTMDRASVDLNSYLYLDKLCLADLAEVAGHPDDAVRFRTEALVLRKKYESGCTIPKPAFSTISGRIPARV